MKSIYNIFFLLIPFFSNAQSLELELCGKLQVLKIETTIVGYPFGKAPNIFKDSLKAGFQLILSDQSYKIYGFRAYYLSDDGDIYFRDIKGNIATKENFLILKHLKGGEVIEIECINIYKQKKYYKSKPCHIFVGK